MRGISIILLVILGLGVAPSANAAQASDIEWVVQNPFRFYKKSKSFQLHENAYKAVRGAPGSPVPNNIIQLVERCLNDPASTGFPVNAACADLSPGLSPEEKRKGWAARTLDDVCYKNRKYPTKCTREQNNRMEEEDYILPQSHTIEIGLSANVPAEEKNGSCEWQWSERADPSKQTTRIIPCNERTMIEKVPFALNRAASGIAVTVKLASGRVISEPAVVVDDRLVISLGDSFSSGEGNPDVPVQFSARYSLEYNRQRQPPVVSSLRKAVPPSKTVAEKNGSYSYFLPRREIKSDGAPNRPDQEEPEFANQFWDKSAKWLSVDCHRSQYGYPVRVALQLAIEDRHRAITFAHLGCSGAEVTDGLLAKMDAREGRSSESGVSAQLAQLTDLLCREDVPKSEREPFMLPVFEPGKTNSSPQPFKFNSCKGKLKRPIDVMMLSIGGNDVGFSALGANVILNSLEDIAWVARFVDKQKRFGPNVADAYLNVLDQRIQALKVALEEDFAVPPSKVIHTSYEPIQYDETGRLCGSDPQLGLDVQDEFSFHVDKLDETAKFLGRLLDRLQCMTNKAKAVDSGIHCPNAMKTGEGTKFTLVVDHQAEFLKRGICARSPADGGVPMQMPKPRRDNGLFQPYNPTEFHPYASRTRLFRSANDAFLTANFHLNGHGLLDQPLIDDKLQPAFAALYSGAIHPTAQAHATVADFVFREASRVLKENP